MKEAFGTLSFEANRGQADPQVQFLARGNGYTLFLTPNEAVLSLETPRKSQTARREFRTGHARSSTGVESLLLLRMTLIDANPQPSSEGLNQLRGKANYLLGNDPAQWRVNIPTYEKVKYTDVYPGVDLVYYGHSSQLEYDFIVAPGVDANVIRLRFEGATRVAIDRGGDLVLSTGVGDVRFERPLVYQEIDGARHTIEGGYINNGVGSHTIGFQLGAYDRHRPLIIDPVLRYSTYIGGSGLDRANGIAVDATGAAYIAGTTSSPDFPISNPLQPTLESRGGLAAFVAKFTPDGRDLVYATYLGGPDFFTDGGAIAVDGTGAAYITGSTSSRDFPTVHPLQSTLSGFQDAYVAKLSPNGNALTYSTYLGGSSSEETGLGIAVDRTGAAYVVGRTMSPDFPVMQPLQPAIGGGHDGFIAKLTADGGALLYATFLGGSGLFDVAGGIAVDAAGAAYIVGFTGSLDFPTVQPYQRTIGGNHDVFVAKVAPEGTRLVFSTYLGGSGNDEGGAITVDAAGNAYVAGNTHSMSFPTLQPLQPASGGNGDAFVAKLGVQGTLLYSTYLGGGSVDEASGIAVDSAGNAYVTGTTASSFNFPLLSPIRGLNTGRFDAFVAKLAPTGTALVYSTLLTGRGEDYGVDVAVDSTGAAYVSGFTESADFPLVAPLQSTIGGYDAFVVKLVPSHVVNELLTLVPDESTFSTSFDTDGCPSDLVGEFSLSARLTNTSDSQALSNLVVSVTSLSNGNLLKNADGGPGGVGNTLTIVRAGGYSDGTLSPGESVEVPFQVCLKTLEPFGFFVDVHSID
jgi:hypothetical protein